MNTPFGRVLRLGMTGDDCKAVKRALARAGYGPKKLAGITGHLNATAVAQLKKFQKANHLAADGVYGPASHAALLPSFDSLATHLYVGEDEQLALAERLLAICRTFTGTYLWGGGHNMPLQEVSTHDDLDCSGSTSLALRLLGIFPYPWAWVSGSFEAYGDPGPGKYVTIHAASDHVWVEFTLPTGWYRFDTSPHGDGPRGPRVRTRPRDETRFVHRHPVGL